LPGSSGCLCARMRAWDREGTLHPTLASERTRLPADGRGTLSSLGWRNTHAQSRVEARGSRARTHDLRSRCSSPDRTEASGGAGKAAAPGRDGWSVLGLCPGGELHGSSKVLSLSTNSLASLALAVTPHSGEVVSVGSVGS